MDGFARETSLELTATVCRDPGSQEGSDQPRRREGAHSRSRRCAHRASGGLRSGRDRRTGRDVGRKGRSGCRAEAGLRSGNRRAARLGQDASCGLQDAARKRAFCRETREERSSRRHSGKASTGAHPCGDVRAHSRRETRRLSRSRRSLLMTSRFREPFALKSRGASVRTSEARRSRCQRSSSPRTASIRTDDGARKS